MSFYVLVATASLLLVSCLGGHRLDSNWLKTFEEVLTSICVTKTKKKTSLRAMPEESTRQAFISIGCNRTPNSADSSRTSGKTAFGAHNTVALWDSAVPESFFFIEADHFRRRRVGGFMLP